MPGTGEVTITIAGEDQSGAVMSAVQDNLQRIQAKAEASGHAMTTAGAHAVTAMDGTRAVVRLMDMDLTRMMRIEELALSKIPGFAKVAQMAFIPISAFAIADGLYRAGKEAYDATQKIEHMAETIRTDFGDANLTFEKQNDDLRVTNDRLEDSIAKLEGKPRNGLAEALDEARVRADDLALSLIRDNNQVAELMKKDSVGFFGEFLGKASTATAEGEQAEYAAKARQIAFEGQEAAQKAKTADEAKAIRLQTQNRLYALQSETLGDISAKLSNIKRDDVAAASAARQASAVGSSYGPAFQPGPKDDSALVSDLQGLYTAIAEQHDRVQLTGKNDDLENLQKQLQTQHDISEEQKARARAADEEQRKEAEWLEKIQRLGIGPSREANYTRQAQAAKMLEENQRQLAEGEDYAAEQTEKDWAASAEAAVKSSQKQIQALRDAQEARIRDAEIGYRNTERDSDFGVRTGKISETERMNELRAAAQQEYQIRANALEMIKSLDSINPDDPDKVQRDLDQIADAQRDYSQQMVTLTQQQYQQQQAAAGSYIHSVLDPLMTGTETLEKRFKRMVDNITGELERLAEDKAVKTLGGAFAGRSGAGGAPASPASAGVGGMASSVMGWLGALFGHKKDASGVASNGALATGAGTAPDGITGALKQGMGMSSSGGVSVQIITQGTPQQAVSAGSSGGGGSQDQQIISILLKDADTLGPISKAMSGAMSMLGSLGG